MMEEETKNIAPDVLPEQADGSSGEKERNGMHGPKPLSKLEARLQQGIVICAEGYLFELERRGWISAGAFVPEVVLEHPTAVEELHREFLRAGSDVIPALTYYGHREKLRLIGKEHLLEALNRQALELARKVAREGDALFAGNICNTNIYDPSNEDSIAQARAMFEEQVMWAKEAGVDYVIAETFSFVGEALLALEIIRKHDLPAVVTMAIPAHIGVREGCSIVDALKMLKEAGATVTGLNCARGPMTMLPLLKDICAHVPGPIAALPVPYRTSPEHPTFQSLCRHDRMYLELEPHLLTRYEMADFAREAVALGVTYVGACCGASPYLYRQMAEALGRRPPASMYSPDLSLHFAFGTHETLKPLHTQTKHLL